MPNYMYTEEEYERRGFPFREFLLKFVLIVIIIFLLVWILSKVITPKTDNKKQKVENNVLSSELFSRKLEKMKIAAINYYTEEKLPKNFTVADIAKVQVKEGLRIEKHLKGSL